MDAGEPGSPLALLPPLEAPRTPGPSGPGSAAGPSPLRWAALGLVMLAAGSSARAQEAPDSLVYTVDEARAEKTEGCSVWRRFEAGLDEDATREDSARFERAVSRLIDQIRSGGPYDLTPFAFTPTDSGVAYTRPLSAHPALPGAASALDRGARRLYVEMPDAGTRVLQYLGVEEDGLYLYGQVGRDQTVYEPPRRLAALPLREGTSWSIGAGEGATRRLRVAGSGELVTPAGTSPVLDLQQSISLGGDSIAVHLFLDPTDGDLRRLARVVVGQRRPSSVRYTSRTGVETASPPDGYRSHCTFVNGLPVTFPVPDGWTVLNLHGEGSATSGVMLARDPEAVGTMGPETPGVSTGTAIRLGPPDNALLSVVAWGMDDRPEEYLESLHLGSIEGAEATGPPEKRVVGDRTVYERRWRGRDGDGRAVVSRKLAFRSAGRLFVVGVLRGPEASDRTADAVRVLLERLTVGR